LSEEGDIEKYMLKTSKFNKVVITMKSDNVMHCTNFDVFSIYVSRVNISFLTQWILLIFFVLSSYYSIHSFYPFIYFLPCSGMSQEVNFAFSSIFTLFLYITFNSYCRGIIFGNHLVGNIIHII
jgi:hypothetical protein